MATLCGCHCLVLDGFRYTVGRERERERQADRDKDRQTDRRRERESTLYILYYKHISAFAINAVMTGRLILFKAIHITRGRGSASTGG